MLDPNKPRILVALGGRSSEREVSINSGQQVVEALEKLGYQTAVLDVGTGKLLQNPELDNLEKDPARLPKVSNLPLVDIKRHFQLVFIVMHGRFGEDGGLQSLLEENGIKYTGSDPLSSALAMNKEFSKKVLKASGLPVLDDQIVTKSDEKCRIPFPVVVKPNDHGSSVGVSVCENDADFAVGLKQALQISSSAIVEPYIKGKELTSAIIEDKNNSPEALPITEIIPRSRFFDTKAKYDGTTEEVSPAKISNELAEKVKKLGVASHKALGCRHFSRVDMIVDEKENVYILELNTIPGLTSESLFPKAAKAGGYEFEKLISHLVDIAIK